MKIVLVILLSLLLAACQPSVVVVPATSAPVVIVVTATPQPDVPTHTPLVPTHTPILPTQTAAPALSPHAACVARNPDRWDSTVNGCEVSRNGSFVEGFASQGGQAVPRHWALVSAQGGIPVGCNNAGCIFRPAGTQHQATTGLRQTLVGIEPGQCYLAKLSWVYRVRSNEAVEARPDTVWPVNILFALIQPGSQPPNLQAFSRPAVAPDPSDANYISSVQEHVWPLRGSSNPTPVVTLSLRSQWGVLTPASTVTLLSAQVFAAPEGFCASGALTLIGSRSAGGAAYDTGEPSDQPFDDVPF